MASGFDSTAFATGLLGGINQANARRQENVDKGEAEQYQAFQEAAKEYDRSKHKLSDQQAKIDALANILSSGKPNAAAYATARDAVEMGYTETGHLPYVMDAYQRTAKDMQDNSEKWSGSKGPSKDQPSMDNPNTADTNPSQTNILRKYGNQMPVQDVENVRQHNLERPYSNLPSAAWGDPEAVANRLLLNKDKTQGQAKMDLAEERQRKQSASLGLGTADSLDPMSSAMPDSGQNQSATTPTPPPVGGATGSPTPVSPLAVKASELGIPQDQPQPAPPDGIKLDGPAPPETASAVQPKDNLGASQPLDQPQPSPNAKNDAYMAQLERTNPTAASTIKMLASGELQISPYMLRDRSDGSHSSWYDMIAAAHKYDPSFDMTDYNSRNRMHISYTSGQDHKSMVAIDTTAGHMGMLVQAVDALGNGNVQALNKLAQYYKIQTGQTPIVTFNAIAHRIAPEIVTAYRATGGTEADIAEVEKDFNSSSSPQQLKEAIAKTAHLLNGKMMALQNAWDTTMGPTKAGQDFYSPNTHDVLKYIGVDTNDKHPFLTEQELRKSNAPLAPKEGTASPDFSHLWSQ